MRSVDGDLSSYTDMPAGLPSWLMFGEINKAMLAPGQRE